VSKPEGSVALPGRLKARAEPVIEAELVPIEAPKPKLMLPPETARLVRMAARHELDRLVREATARLERARTHPHLPYGS
jgi:hypothetical protein